MHRWLGKNQTQPTRLETPENQTVWKLLKTRHRGTSSLLTHAQPRDIFTAAMLVRKLLHPGSSSRPSHALVKSNHWEDDPHHWEKQPTFEITRSCIITLRCHSTSTTTDCVFGGLASELQITLLASHLNSKIWTTGGFNLGRHHPPLKPSPNL